MFVENPLKNSLLLKESEFLNEVSKSVVCKWIKYVGTNTVSVTDLTQVFLCKYLNSLQLRQVQKRFEILPFQQNPFSRNNLAHLTLFDNTELNNSKKISAQFFRS